MSLRFITNKKIEHFFQLTHTLSDTRRRIESEMLGFMIEAKTTPTHKVNPHTGALLDYIDTLAETRHELDAWFFEKILMRESVMQKLKRFMCFLMQKRNKTPTLKLNHITIAPAGNQEN